MQGLFRGSVWKLRCGASESQTYQEKSLYSPFFNILEKSSNQQNTQFEFFSALFVAASDRLFLSLLENSWKH